MINHVPRVVIGAVGSGHGKTTVTSGLLGALRAEGLEVAGFKIGPDYIDPGYHTLVTGRPGRNLDPFLCRTEQLVPLLLHGMSVPTPADVAVVEGVMGLFDGQLGTEGFASTAHVAQVIDAPVIVVLDISHTSRTAAALVAGLRAFDPGLRLAGVILNKAGSSRHADEVVSACENTGVEVFGVLPRNAGIEAPSRHLGLVPAAERDDAAAALARLAGQVGEHVDLTRVLAVAHAAGPLDGEVWRPEDQVHPPSGAPYESPSERRPVVAVAGGRAFTFRYPETDELLRAAGSEPVIFDPLRDDRLPEGTAGLYLGGGFPEVHAAELAGNRPMINAVRKAIDAGLPTVAECAGVLYLCRSVDGQPMVGALPADAAMTPRLVLGYRTGVADHDQLLGPAGTRVRGHEFHRTAVTSTDETADGAPAWLLDGQPDGFSLDPAGAGRPTVHASYLHIHWAGHPRLAQTFADAVHHYAERTDPSTGSGRGEHDLDHHGDAEVADGLVDLAVNVRLPAPPPWLVDVINATTPALAAYPRADGARSAIAAAHGVPRDHALPTAGAAEAFTLLARARYWHQPTIIHPQFTEPEAALRAAGYDPTHVVLGAGDGFRLDPGRVPDDADLVIIGNPTNPTSVLHPAATLRRLARPGRVLFVDEAFMDAVPGEPESLVGGDVPGLLVLRSLTKTWGLAGLRAGYAVGDPALIADLERQQPPWSVSTPALAVIEACLAGGARQLASEAARELADHRDLLVDGLVELGLCVGPEAAAPFVLVRTHDWVEGRPPGWVRAALSDAGFAVRRGDTFPGLDADWIRIAVREPDTTRALLKALTVLREQAG